METLSTQPSYESAGKRKRGQEAWELREEKSGQTLAVTHDEPLVAYQLDVGERPEREKMADGVLIGELGGQSIVCFVELKSTLKQPVDDPGTPDRTERALSQLEAAVAHFHPAGRAGGSRAPGDDHHDAWTSGDDALTVMPTASHEVLGVVVTYRSLPRRPPEAPRQVGPTVVRRAVVQVSPATMNRAATTFSRLLELAGRNAE
jgi:hypothetical protein